MTSLTGDAVRFCPWFWLATVSMFVVGLLFQVCLRFGVVVVFVWSVRRFACAGDGGARGEGEGRNMV